MPPTDLADAALILIGHGATDNAESTATLRWHAAALRRRGIFRQVLEAFYKVPPWIQSVWDSVDAPRAYVMPLCISEGYFTSEVIPRALGLAHHGPVAPPGAQRFRHREVYYCAPIGTHARMAEVVLSRARTVVEACGEPNAPSPDTTTLFLAGHGTERNPRSRAAIEFQVQGLGERHLYAAVHPLFMMEPPRVRDWDSISQTPDNIVVPFFISDGLHTAEDIPVLLGESRDAVRERLARGQPGWVNPTRRHGRRLWYSSAVGSDPLVTELILARVREASTEPRKD